MILDKIIADTKDTIAARKERVSLPELIAKTPTEKIGASFYEALSKKSYINLIAEVKKASPSKGLIREDFNPVEIAVEYEKAGASAISVLTEEKYFLGSLDYLKTIRKEVKIPILRKDFIVDVYQIYEAKEAGADAILLIVAALSEEELTEYITLARSLSMDCLVEVHTLKEMEKALKTPAKIIGINNRNLKTFNVDINTTISIANELPDNIVKISESGIFTRDDVVKLVEEGGVNGILVGESLMRSEDIEGKVNELLAI